MTTATETYRYSRLHINRFTVDVPTVAIGRTVYFPLRALCQVVGIAPQMQIEKLRKSEHYRGALRDDVPVPTSKGERRVTCLRKQEVGRWLSELEPSRCAISARGPIRQFQAELFAAADRWLFGDTSDVVYDAGAKSDKPVYGTLHLGDCPRCGLGLCLVLDADGQHLRPEADED